MERVRTALQRLRGKTGFVVAVVLVASSTRGADVPNTRQLPLLARAAETVGVRRCVAALAAVAARTSGTALHQDVILDWDRSAPDDHVFHSLTGLQYGDHAAALSLSAVPEASGGCSILAERISAAPLGCAVVARSELAGYVGHPLLASIDVYTNPKTPRETVTLISTPPGCLIIRRQVEYNWRLAL